MSDLMYALYARVTSAAFSLRDKEDGQSMVEYALILVLVAVVVAGTFTLLEGRLHDALETIKFK